MRIWPALLLFLFILAAEPAAARDTHTIRVLASLARPEFASAITFELAAESDGADIVAVELLYGATRGEALTIVELKVTPGPQVQVSHRLDTQVYHFPPGAELTYRWRIIDAAGNILESEPQQLLYHDTRFNWREHSTRNVTVLWYAGDDSFGQELLDSSNRTLDRLQAALGAELELPVRIYIYANIGDMRGALRTNEVEWVGGQAWPALGVIVGAIGPGDIAEVRRLIPHELTHQVLHQATDNPYGGTPVWFDEGLAVYYQETRDFHYDNLIEEAARAGELIPLEALASSFPADPNQASLSYAQSREVVAFIAATYGEEKLGELAAAFAVATPLEQALQDALGLTVDDLDAAWRATLPGAGPQPTPQPGPQSAPPDRFSEPPVLPAAQLPVAQPAPVAPAQPAAEEWGARIEALPPWMTIGGAALCCVVGVALLGAALLVGLRLIGVDKQV